MSGAQNVWTPDYAWDNQYPGRRPDQMPSPPRNPNDQRDPRDPPPPPTQPRADLQLNLQETQQRQDELATHISPTLTDFPPPRRPNTPLPIAVVHGPLARIVIPELEALVLSFLNHRDVLTYQIAMGRTPCTEGLGRHDPWNPEAAWLAHPDNWIRPCPNYASVIIGGPRGPVVRSCESGDDCTGVRTSLTMNHALPPWDAQQTASTARVCQRHQEATRQMYPHDHRIDLHRVGSCTYHRNLLQARYPQGLNSCVCEKWMGRWICRRDYLRLGHQYARNFYHRVKRDRPNSNGWSGGADAWLFGGLIRFARREFISYTYQDRPVAAVRAHLALNHPCGLGCGRVRENQTDVMDCRACGGCIIQPLPRRVTRKRKNVELFELDDHQAPIPLDLANDIRHNRAPPRRRESKRQRVR